SADEPGGDAETEAGEEYDRDRDAWKLAEHVAADVGGEPEDGADREIDVPRDHDHRLAEREQGEDRRVDQDEADVVEREEARLEGRRHEHEDPERGEDAELAQPVDPLNEPASPEARGSGDSLRAHRHAAAASSWPVAAATIRS